MDQKVIGTGSLSQLPFGLSHRLIEGEATRAVACHLFSQIALDLHPGRFGKDRARFEIDQAQSKPAQSLVLYPLYNREAVLPSRIVERSNACLVSRAGKPVIDALFDVRGQNVRLKIFGGDLPAN